jgi:hypothetical protein
MRLSADNRFNLALGPDWNKKGVTEYRPNFPGRIDNTHQLAGSS